jgi:predicted MPP superfamily phosphohydrolase
VIPGLDPAFDGYRLVQITDLHVGHWLSLDRLAGVVDLVNQQQPDLIVMTGDFVSYVVSQVEAGMVSAFSRLSAPDGVLAILGNHDHWMDPQRVSAILAQAGVVVLRNQVYHLQRQPADGGPPATLSIAGLDDITVGWHDLEGVLGLLSGGSPAILLAHEPDFADEAAATHRFALQLSGHSHGGQIVTPSGKVLVRGPMFKKYPNGLYQVGDMVQYTNRGVGTHVLRVRINCPPEITVITLRSDVSAI